MRLLWLCLAWAVAVATPAWAHDPFDGTVELTVYEDKLEAKVTLGFDATRAFLAASGLTPAAASELKRTSAEQGRARMDAQAATGLLRVQAGAAALAPTALYIAHGQEETNLLAIYARPEQGDTVELRALWFEQIEHMRPGALLALTQDRRLLARAPLTREHPSVQVPLTVEAALAAQPASSAPAQAGFIGYFKLGVEHILTGFDHLLFLCALLVCVHGIRSMLIIVTAFTLAHSVTLALAALDLVVLPAAFVEPVIALSIMLACAHNLLRRDAPKARYGMAAGFGLIHGFGFAGALRETGLGQGGSDLVLPLFSFNLGVEAGQLLVAACVIPLFLLARRQPWLARYSAPALSVAVMVVSAYWLAERMQLLPAAH
jgi:hydrogenase/urease accessory protein HupE